MLHLCDNCCLGASLRACIPPQSKAENCIAQCGSEGRWEESSKSKSAHLQSENIWQRWFQKSKSKSSVMKLKFKRFVNNIWHRYKTQREKAKTAGNLFEIRQIYIVARSKTSAWRYARNCLENKRLVASGCLCQAFAFVGNVDAAAHEFNHASLCCY